MSLTLPRQQGEQTQGNQERKHLWFTPSIPWASVPRWKCTPSILLGFSTQYTNYFAARITKFLKPRQVNMNASRLWLPPRHGGTRPLGQYFLSRLIAKPFHRVRSLQNPSTGWDLWDLWFQVERILRFSRWPLDPWWGSDAGGQLHRCLKNISGPTVKKQNSIATITFEAESRATCSSWVSGRRGTSPRLSIKIFSQG